MPGVYAAGDITSQEGVDSLNLIVIGFRQVTVAVNYTYARIKPGAKVPPVTPASGRPAGADPDASPPGKQRRPPRGGRPDPVRVKSRQASAASVTGLGVRGQ